MIAVEDQAVVEAVSGELLKFSTVFGASSSNSSIVMSPWLVVIVASDIAGLLSCEIGSSATGWPLDLGHALDDRGDGVGRDLEQREALEHADVADRLAVEARRAVDRGDQVGGLDALVAAGGGDQLRVAARRCVAARRRRGLRWRRGRGSDGRRRRDVRALDPRRDRRRRVALDRLEVAPLARLDERDRAAGAPDAAGAADAVHVDVGRGRDVEVDDVRDRRDVQPAGGDVGGDEDRHAAALEGDHHAVARALAHVAVQRLDVHALGRERAVELVAADLGAREDDRLVGPLGLEHARERLGLLLRLGLEVELLDGVDRQRRGLDLDRHRVVQVALGELA